MYRPLVEQKGWSGSGRKSSQNDHFKNCFIRTNQAFKLQYISTRFLNPSAKPTNEIFRYLLHFCPTRRLYHHVAALQSGTTSCLLQIACSTLGTSLKLDPKLSKFTFYRKKVGFNTKVNKGTFCYKQLCPHHGSQTIRMEYAFCTGLAFRSGNFNGDRFLSDRMSIRQIKCEIGCQIESQKEC